MSAQHANQLAPEEEDKGKGDISAILDSTPAFPAMDPSIAHSLYTLLAALHSLLTHASIPYWLDSGSLLGAVRHGGLIPWDDDADVQLFECDRERLQKLVIDVVQAHQQEEGAGPCEASDSDNNSSPPPSHPCSSTRCSCCPLSGLEFFPTFFGWKLCERDAPRVPGHPWRYPAVDLFFVHKPSEPKETACAACSSSDDELDWSRPAKKSASRQRLILSSARAQKCWGNMNFFADEILGPSPSADATALPAPATNTHNSALPASTPSAAPSSSALQLYPFGPLHLYGPPLADARAYLSRCYGADWPDVAYRIFDHAREVKHSPEERRRKVPLTEQDRLPAQPVGEIASMRCTCAN